MHDPVLTPARSSAADRSFGIAPPALPTLLQTPEACQYRALSRAFRASGGIVSADEVLVLLARHTSQPISQLAHWIVDRDVISFSWQARTMLPLFQFELATMTLRPAVGAVLRELAPAMSDWEICLWFAAPNAWLADASPLYAIGRDAPAVIDAARGERFLLRA